MGEPDHRIRDAPTGAAPYAPAGHVHSVTIEPPYSVELLSAAERKDVTVHRWLSMAALVLAIILMAGALALTVYSWAFLDRLGDRLADLQPAPAVTECLPGEECGE